MDLLPKVDRQTQQRAHKAVADALAAGLLERPTHCTRCLTPCKPDGHHRSYHEVHWLAVVWLCHSCHFCEHEGHLEPLTVSPPVEHVARLRAAGTDRTITARQATVLQSVIDHIAMNGLPPTIREIGGAVGMRWVLSVTKQLDALERDGFIVRTSSKARAIRVLKNPDGSDYRRAGFAA